jgi:hypothetical protein
LFIIGAFVGCGDAELDGVLPDDVAAAPPPELNCVDFILATCAIVVVAIHAVRIA